LGKYVKRGALILSVLFMTQVDKTKLLGSLGFYSGMGTKLFLSKLAGYLIVAGSVVMKVPQILKINRNQSAEGISPLMMYLDSLVMLQSAAFALSNSVPFSVYGDNFFLLIQGAIITAQMWHFNKDIIKEEKIGVAAALSIWSFYLLYNGGSLISSHFWPFILASNALISKYYFTFIVCFRHNFEASSISQEFQHEINRSAKLHNLRS
jgi:hypothetical protein